MIAVKITKLNLHAKLPEYMTVGAAGCDITACLEVPIILKPHDRFAIPTGIAIEIPSGFEVQVRPRSGLALRQGLTVVNAPGTIDSDYRGEVKVLLINLGQETVTINSGDRIAQLVLQKVEQIEWLHADELSDTARAQSGFGSTGISNSSCP